MLKFLSVCSGMEAASVAWEPLGFKAVGFSEIEPFPCAILKHQFPDTPNYGSLTEYQSWPLEQGSIDLLVGGTPCQSFSVAGLRKGLEDPRGNLALTFLGLADKLRPRWIVWENVPGVLSSSGGRDFGAFLGALGQLGYGWAYRVLDAQHFGVPQRRRRVFVVATSTGDGRLAAEVLSLPEGLRGYLETRQQKRKGAAADAGAGAEADGRSTGTINCQPDGISGTVTSKWHKGSGGPAGDEHYNMVTEQKPIVIDRAAFNQGENAQYEPHIEETDVMDSLIARGPHAVGQPLTMRESGQGFWMQDDKAGTIRAEGENRPSRPSHVIGEPVPYRKAKRAQSTTDDESCVEGEVSNTLNNFDLGDTRTTHAVVEPTQHCADVAPTVTSSGPPYSRTGNERVESEALVAQPIAFTTEQTPKFNNDQALTLTKQSPTGGGQPQCVAQPFAQNQLGEVRVGDVFNTLNTNSNASGRNTPMVGQGMAVRRLTPVECERLQGFPDNWSRIPWKGKPEEDCPDGPRYKACGNSMAVPVMRWIGKRIAEVDAEMPR